MNEESVSNVMAYFNEVKEKKEREQSIRQMNLGRSVGQGQVINAFWMGQSQSPFE